MKSLLEEMQTYSAIRQEIGITSVKTEFPLMGNTMVTVWWHFFKQTIETNGQLKSIPQIIGCN